MKSLTEYLNRAIEKREAVVSCTVVETSGSTPAKAGAKMLVWPDGRIVGTIGGGNIEKRVMDEAIELYQAGGHPVMKEYALLKEQMCCGGTMKIFIEPVRPRNQLVLFGAGHIGNHIAYFADRLDFSVVVVDERKAMLEALAPGESEKINLNHRHAFQRIVFDKNTYVVICTHLHAYDREILAHCIHLEHAYLGMIGSMRKVLVTKKMFLEQNLATQSQLDEVDMPMGFDFGQKSTAEIALGILAKIVSVANRKSIIQLDESDHPAVSEESIPGDCFSKSIKQHA